MRRAFHVVSMADDIGQQRRPLREVRNGVCDCGLEANLSRLLAWLAHLCYDGGALVDARFGADASCCAVASMWAMESA